MFRLSASIKKRILVIGGQCVNSLKILDVTKSNFFHLKDFHSDQWI